MGSPKPSRYALDGAPPDIVCSDWPTMHLHVERGLSIDKRELKSFPRQSIFLDGVFTGPAFLNNESRQYSLDHHAGCVRAFTLATCEQACVMLMQRLPLWEGEWQVYVNEPDLDSLLGAWILLNHYALSHDNYALLRKVMPLIRVEGVIDTFGLDKALLSGLPRRIYEAKYQRIMKLRQPEQQLREKGEWSTTDLVAFSKSQLERLDSNLFPHGSPRIGGIEKLKLDRPTRTLAFLVPTRRGIYEIEEELRAIHKDELAVIVLDSGHGRMTLRLVNPFMPKNLNAAYAALNARDERVRDSDDSNVWGGSAEIGGAPRRTGTGLSGREVLETVIDALNSDD
ncbi:MAG TPA: hypothetical protein ENK23_06905, partial [Sorangium sp.]|nr:hypothetical protein [Sorangium sp.]